MAGARRSLHVVRGDTFAARLRARRLADDMTQADLGRRFGVRQQTIGAWERGERPQGRFVDGLAVYLGLTAEALTDLLDATPLSNGAEVAEPDPISALTELQANAAAVRRLTEGFAVALERGSVSGETATAFAAKALDFLSQ